MTDAPAQPEEGNRLSAAPYSYVRPLVASRVEILLTFAIDALLVTAAAFVRAGFLWLLELLPATQSWPLKVLELILDYGLLGTALIITAFDLLKRIRVAYQEFTDDRSDA